MSDERLIELVASGDEHAFRVIWTRHAYWILAIARSFCKSDEDANDLLQEMMAKIHRASPQFTAISSFRSWAKQVARNVGIDYVRRRALHIDRTTDNNRLCWDHPDVRYAPEYLLESEIIRAELREAVELLPEIQRLTIVMRYFGAMSMKDIAWAMRVPAGTVKSRIHAAMLNIRTHLKIQDKYGGTK